MKKLFIISMCIIIIAIIIIGIILTNRHTKIIQNAEFILETSEEYKNDEDTREKEELREISEEPVFTADHLDTPVPVKAIYISSWIAATPQLFDQLVNFIDTTEINTVVLDIKDATGRVSFLTDEPLVASTGSPENRIKNIKDIIAKLHEKNIYVIGRISTFQDPYLTKVKPSWAITKKSDGSVWKDRKGLSFLDPANQDVWDYNVALASASYKVGFDEINFDYIRYPSDGNMQDIDYKFSQKENGLFTTRAENIELFMRYLDQELRTRHPEIKTSADLFGLTTSEKTDMGIGQLLEKSLPYFDYIGPMIYPSHYAAGEYGITEPARHPGVIVARALQGAKQKIEAIHADLTVSKEIKARVSYSQIRPWLQDFSIGGVTYTPEMVRDQIQAVYDSGLDSWVMWDPSNKYTRSAYLLE